MLKLIFIKLFSLLFTKKKNYLVIISDDCSSRLIKICKALDKKKYPYTLFLIKSDLNYIHYIFLNNTVIIKNNFLGLIKLLKYKGANLHFILSSNLVFAKELFELKLFKNIIDMYDHRFLYKKNDSIIKQQNLEKNIINFSEKIICRSISLRFESRNKYLGSKKKILFLDYCEKLNEKKFEKKNFYNLLMIFPRHKSIKIYKNIIEIFLILLKQNFKIFLILDKKNINFLNEIVLKKKLHNIFPIDFMNYIDYKKYLEKIDCYVWLPIEQIVDVDSNDYNYVNIMHRYISSNRIYDMIENNIFSASPQSTRFDSYILKKFSNCFVYNNISELSNFRNYIESIDDYKIKSNEDLLIDKNIERLIKFYEN